MHIGYDLSNKLLKNASVKQLENDRRTATSGPFVQEYVNVFNKIFGF